MDILEKLERAARLPSPPGIAVQILSLAQKENVSLVQVADALAADPALSMRILKYVNSPLVGVPREVTSVRDAVVLLGMRTVRMMALSFSLVSKEERLACPGFDYDQFWADSLAHAIAARHLAKRTHVPTEEAFAAALLASLGKLTFAIAVPAEYAQILAEARAAGTETNSLERDWFGADFCEVGGGLLERWGIPARLAMAVRYQRDPENSTLSKEIKALASTVNQASPYVRIISAAPGAPQPAKMDLPGALPTPADHAALIAEMRRDYLELASILGAPGSDREDVDKIRAQAGAALSGLSLPKPQASAPGESLKPESKQPAIAPSWPKLSDRMPELWKEALRAGRPISVALLEIDGLANLIAEHGEAAGDAAARAVGEAIRPCLRSVDFVAQCRRERFAVVLPHADRLTAAGIFVGMRRAVEENPLRFRQRVHRITISLGAAILSQPTPLYTSQMLLDAAIQQLRRSKQKGCNACSMAQLSRTPTAGLVAGH